MMPLNLPFVQLKRNKVLDNAAVSECKTVKISGCFLCGIKSVADSRSLPDNVTRQEKAALFRDLLINPTVRKNTSPSSYNQFMSSTESCSDCLSLIKEVYALRQGIVDLEKELENRLEESRRKYLNGCEIVANSLTVGRIKLHAGGQYNSSTLSTVPARKFSPMQMSPEVEDDESIDTEEEEDMSSEFVAEKENMSIDEEEEVTPSEFQEEMSSKFDQEEEYTPPNGKPTGRTLQAKNEHSNNATINPSANTNGLICSRCGMTFSRNDTFRRHERRQVCKENRNPTKIEGAFSCSKCFLLFPTRRWHIIHEMHVCNVVYTQEQVEPLTLYTCPLCDKQFVDVWQYKRHYSTHSEVEKSVVLDQLPRRHQDNHTSKYVNECEILGNSLTGRRINESIDPDEDENMSSECDEEEENKPPNGKPTGRTLQAKNEHSNNATINPSANTRSLKCSNCGITFSSWANLKLHERRQVCTKTRNSVYIEEFFFSCSKCFQRFPTKRRKIIHEMNICNVVYTQEQVEPMTLYTCSLCSKQFVNLCDYQRHYRSHAEVKNSVDLDRRPRRHRDNHTPARNVSFVAQKSVDSVRQPQDNRSPVRNVVHHHQANPKPLRNVSSITEKEIPPYEPLLGGKLTIHNCPHCTRWFVKEDNLRTHLAKDHRTKSFLIKTKQII
ncbi:zinc finger protein 791 [Folsomia candida]|nr:zinc finger protein 791 [Folsomia candida]